MIMQKALIVAIGLVATSNLGTAWEGTNANTGSSVKIERGQLVPPAID